MNIMSKWVRLTKGLNDKGILIKPEDIDTIIDENREKDYYTSIFYYTDDHYKDFQKNKTIRGISNLKTDKLVFDFDHKDNIEIARQDTLIAIERLNQYNISDNNIEIYFSGNKGFSLVVTLDVELTPDQLKYITIKKIGYDLKTLDKQIYNASRIFRVPGTKHQTSGLYKIPLTKKELSQLTIENIKHKALSLDNVNGEDFYWENAHPDKKLLETPKEESKPIIESNKYKINFTNKPPNWRNCKYSLLMGNFPSGERHQALLVLAATCRGLGYDKEDTYYLCKSALKKQAKRTGSDEFPKDELWNNIINQSVFTDHWEGGQYSCQKEGWLQDYCNALGEHSCKKNANELTVEIDQTFHLFKDYAENIDNLTVKTGIPALDQNLRMTIGMSVGIVGSPGTGKTSIVLQMLNNMSKSGEQCIFFSYDMYHALVFQKLVQKHCNMTDNEIFDKFKNKDEEFQQNILTLLKNEYKNVDFCFQAGQSPDEIMDTIDRVQERTGKKVRFIVIDYNELVVSDKSDNTSASAEVAQKIRAIANTYNLCALVLLQPNKTTGTPADEILSYRAAKGSSSLEQSFSVMLGISRPGYHPRYPDQDKFITINCLKNRMGKLFNLELHWDGLTGSVREMSPEEKHYLEEVKEQRKLEKMESKKDDWT